MSSSGLKNCPASRDWIGLPLLASFKGEIWHEVHEADLVFCDVTGYNANVMFEAGVCAEWKPIQQVVLIRDHFYKGQSPFDPAPIRYTEYMLTSDGVDKFKQKIKQLVTDAVIAFPDQQGSATPPDGGMPGQRQYWMKKVQLDRIIVWIAIYWIQEYGFDFARS